jgi:predicted MFS family arabinose efflux permease
MAMVSSADDAQRQFADVRRRLSAIFIGSIGNLVEWYDFYTYAAFALYFASAFFPGGDAVVQQLNAAVLFAIGFIVRPIGGWLFGHLADRYGRRRALMLSVLLMCFGSLMIASPRPMPVSASPRRRCWGSRASSRVSASAANTAPVPPISRKWPMRSIADFTRAFSTSP